MGDDGTEQPATLGRRALIRGTATLVAAGGVATTTNAADGPTAAFVLDPERPDPGESATLDATPSQGSGTPITRYEWEVDGRARPASGREVFQTWRDPGLYQVTLTVTDGDGRSDTTQRYVEVFNEPPTPAFETDPSDVEAGQPVTLDASTANDPDGRIVDYEWELTGSDGGTETASGETTTVTWEDDGTVTVRLTVVDDGGAERSLTEELWVGNRTPGAACAVQTDDPVQYEPVTVDGTLSVDRDGDVVDYEWAYETAFGTQYATGPTIQHAFQQPGTYRFELTVTDDDGATDT
ncbi:PKD domain-containing protein, partial [Halapricum sp. CBA1109]|uniref:PKD domain-containing protein n=1 Tax=Halapricum sp. CBA1109 TaxID=2668068 RepID=UPI0012F8D1A2